MPLVIRDNQAEWSLRRGQRLIVTPVRHEHDPVGKRRIEFRQGKDDPVPVGGFDHEVQGQAVTTELLA
jgi:hypothetical protein